MMEAAAQAIARHRARGGRTGLLAVTVLTSLDRNALAQAGVNAEPYDLLLGLARLARRSGCDGVVCSAQEAGGVKEACGAAFQCLTPGIRPATGDLQDQAWVATPREALRNGSDWLVVGRPITRAADPAAAADAILAELAEA